MSVLKATSQHTTLNFDLGHACNSNIANLKKLVAEQWQANLGRSIIQ